MVGIFISYPQPDDDFMGFGINAPHQSYLSVPFRQIVLIDANLVDPKIGRVTVGCKTGFPPKYGAQIFRRPADRLRYPRLTKSSQAPSSGAGGVPVNAGTCGVAKCGD